MGNKYRFTGLTGGYYKSKEDEDKNESDYRGEFCIGFIVLLPVGCFLALFLKWLITLF